MLEIIENLREVRKTFRTEFGIFKERIQNQWEIGELYGDIGDFIREVEIHNFTYDERAIFVDGGLSDAPDFVRKFFEPQMDSYPNNTQLFIIPSNVYGLKRDLQLIELKLFNNGNEMSNIFVSAIRMTDSITRRYRCIVGFNITANLDLQQMPEEFTETLQYFESQIDTGNIDNQQHTHLEIAREILEYADVKFREDISGRYTII